MVTIKTKVAKPIFNNRWKKIDEQVIYLTITELKINVNHIIADGFYFYKKEVDKEEMTDVILTSFSTRYAHEVIEEIEKSLKPLSVLSYFEATLQRTREFIVIQQQLESGDNFGILFEEWEI